MAREKLTKVQRVDPKAYAEAMKIIAAADPNDRMACRMALNEANAICGIAPRSGRQALVEEAGK